jgi:hypothetical protein
MSYRSILMVLILATAWPAVEAQPVVAPTPNEPVTASGETTGGYNVVNSFETGYRWSVIGGDRGMYRADVNYGNGIRLLGSNLMVNNKEGHGRLFDELILNTTGLGNDPYQFASIRMQKNGLYRYDGVWRSSDYFNPGYVISGAAHLMDTERHMQDHEVRLLPLRHVEFRLGYARNDERGPAFSTEQGLNNQLTMILPLFSNVRRDWNEYRLGADIDLFGFKLTVMRQWDFYKDDTAFSGALGGIPGVIDNQIGATAYGHGEPVRGYTPGWLGNLNTARRNWSMNARMTYVNGQGNFLLNEFGTSLGQRNTTSNFQTLVSGDARRPVMAGDFSLSVSPTQRLTLTANNSVQTNRIDGNALVSTLTPFGTLAQLAFQYLGIRTLATSLDAQYRFSNWFGLFAAYEYSTRLIRSEEAMTFQGGGGAGPGPGGRGDVTVEEQNNHLNIGRIGFQVKPWQPLTVRMEGELGRDNHPFLALNDRNYHAINGRVDYRTRRLRLGAGYRQIYNVNSPSVTSFHSSHGRTYSANASFTVNRAVSLDAGYTKLHLDTAGSLAFFAGAGRANTLYSNYPSLYFSNVHSVNLGVRWELRGRTTFYAGYNLTRDPGDGRNSPAPAAVSDPIAQVFDGVQTFPMSYQSPMARVTFRVSRKVQWNAGWQLYRYRQQFVVLGFLPNYHANTGYTSISWSF